MDIERIAIIGAGACGLGVTKKVGILSCFNDLETNF